MNKRTMTLGALSILVLVTIGVFSGCTRQTPPQQIPYTPTTPTEPTPSATFTIVPTAYHNSGFTIASGATTFKLPYNLNQTHNVKESDNTSWNSPYMNFTITPNAWDGAQSTDLATIYYDYTDMNALVATDSGNYYFLTLSSGYRQAKFTQKANTGNYGYGSGSITTALTTPVTLYLNLSVINASLCMTNAVLYGASLQSVPTITFHNSDYTWTVVYTIDVFPSRIWKSG